MDLAQLGIDKVCDTEEMTTRYSVNLGISLSRFGNYIPSKSNLMRFEE